MQRRAEHVRSAVASLPRPTPVLCSAPGSSFSVLCEVRVLLGEGREHGVGGVDELGELLVLAAERFHQQPEVVDRARDVRVADFELLGDLLAVRRAVGSKRLSVADSALPLWLRPSPAPASSSCR